MSRWKFVIVVRASDEFLNACRTCRRAETGPHGKFAGVGSSGCLLFLFLATATDDVVVVVVVVVVVERCGDAPWDIILVSLFRRDGKGRMEKPQQGQGE